MTGCFYFSPNQLAFPCILTDTIVTSGKINSESISPATISKNTNFRSLGNLYLARKSFILNEHCAIAVAGDENKIADFLEYARPLVDFPIENLRPIKTLSERASNYGKNVNVIGSYVLEDRVNFVRPEHSSHTEIGQLGLCMAIGSGSKQLLNMARNIEADLPPNLHPISVVENVSRLINQHRIYDEMHSKIVDQSWGGFLEELYFDGVNQCWKRRGSTIVLNYVGIVKDKKFSVFDIVNRIICYDPGIKNGNILCINGNNPTLIVNYVLKDLLHPEMHSHFSLEEWSAWKPEKAFITICIGEFLENGEFDHIYTHGSIDLGEFDKVSLFVSDEKFSIDIFSDQIENMLNDALLNYFSETEI